MARLTAISGLGRKSAAVFLLEAQSRRILLDLGAGIERDEHPDLSRVGRVDAVILSHGHIDHAGGLDRLAEVGNPPVYATAETLRQIGRPPTHILPERGAALVAGLPIQTGRAGHAPGGIWVQFPTIAGGILYTGDFSTEAPLLPFDPFERARVVLADASYGDRDIALADQIAHVAERVAQGAILPCPAWGRGPDMVAALTAAGLNVHACPQISQECALIGLNVPTVTSATARPNQVIVALGPNAEEGLPASLLAQDAFRLVFSSHVPASSPAQPAIQNGRACWMGWNVHPRLSDLIALVRTTGAERIIPAFVDLANAPQLVTALGQTLWTQEILDL